LALSKNWRSEAKLKTPKPFRVESLDADILVRPMSALPRSEIEKAHPFSEDGKRDATKFVADLIADSVVTENGEKVFTADELLGEEVGYQAFEELTEIVSGFILPVLPKNSIPASVSPSV